MSDRFVRPTRLDAVVNTAVAALTRVGLPLAGSRVLAVRGRASGEWRTTPVNRLRVGGVRYLSAPRGTTRGVRSLRAACGGELRAGRSIGEFRAEEVPDAHKPPILRASLVAWAWEVGRFFESVDKNSPDERLREMAPGFPVFRLHSGSRR